MVVVEPHVKDLPEKLRGKCNLLSAENAVEVADIVVLLVDHKDFKSLSRPVLAEKIVIDTRGFWE